MIVDDYFLVEPDWQYYLESGRRWRTSIQLSLSKDEKRSKLKSYPTKRLLYSVVPFSADENNYIRRKLYRGSGKIFGVPIWTDRCATTQVVDSGSGTTFTVDDNSIRQFEVGAPLILFQDINNYEVQEIVTVGSNSFTVGSSFTGTWPSSTDVYPILQGRIQNSHNLREETTYGHGALMVECTEEYDPDITRTVYSGSTFTTFLDLPVLNLEPNRVATPESTIEVFPEISQFLSKSIDYTHTTEGQIRTSALWTFESRAAAYDLVKFFDEQCGRWSNFWYPSWMDDIVLTAPFDSIDTVLEIEDIEWDTYWSDTVANGSFIYILLPDGTEIIRNITGAPSDVQITVDAAMGTTITSLAGVICCFLYMGRFNKDEITLEYASEGYISSKLEMATLQDITGYVIA